MCCSRSGHPPGGLQAYGWQNVLDVHSVVAMVQGFGSIGRTLARKPIQDIS